MELQIDRIRKSFPGADNFGESDDKNYSFDSNRRILLPCCLSERVVFDGGEGNYLVLDARIDPTRVNELKPDDLGFPNEWTRRPFKVIVRSEMEIINPAITYMMSGRVVDKAKYGHQFDVDFYYIADMQDMYNVRRYLDKMPNVGPIRADKIVKRFGTEGFSGIEKAMEGDGIALTEIPGITAARAMEIVQAWNKDVETRQLYLWLAENAFPLDKIGDIFSSFGKKTRQIIEYNPYVLAKVKGITFALADAFAHKIGRVDHVQRITACVDCIITAWMREGHLCMEIDHLARESAKLVPDYKEKGTFESHFADAVRQMFVIVKMRNKTFVYIPNMFESERVIARCLADISNHEPNDYLLVDDELIDFSQEHVSRWTGRDIVLDQCQRNAIMSAFNKKLTVITGGGGTGKSTICQCIKTIAHHKGLSVVFAAPTGAAAKVLAVKTGTEASTIHRLLKLSPNGNASRRGSEDSPYALNCNLLVIDEFSMVGIDTMAHVALAIEQSPGINVVFVGDPQQLPSVSPGSFLTDLIASDVASVVKLSVVHRQSETSYIPYVADEMAKGIFDGFPESASDIKLYETANEETMKQYLLACLRTYISENGTLDGLQIIASMKTRGEVCVREINDLVQAILFNDQKDKFVEFNCRKFYVGDRVMQTVNDYEKDVFNGNIGVVVDCGEECDANGRKMKFVTVKYDQGVVNGLERPPLICKYVKKQLDDIMVCWCSTVHKFQGSQADTVVFMAPNSHMHMMKRELVYTAFTRAAQMLHVIGNSELLRKATFNSIIMSRYTHTKEMIMLRKGSLVIPDMIVKNTHLCVQKGGRPID